MNDEKPSGSTIDGRPFDGGLGPTAQATEGVPIGRPQLNADQLRGDTKTPSWKAPRERSGLSTATLIAIVVAVAVLLLIVLWAAGVL
jgi:hypothetical protein